jgi:hypothetical protein
MAQDFKPKVFDWNMQALVEIKKLVDEKESTLSKMLT